MKEVLFSHLYKGSLNIKGGEYKVLPQINSRKLHKSLCRFERDNKEKYSSFGNILFIFKNYFITL